MLYSRIKSFAELVRQPDLSPTGSAVVQLCRSLSSLPSNSICESCVKYIVYLDNGFATIPLFEKLREKGIGACGTTRINSPRYPLSLKAKQSEELLEWNTIDGCVVSSSAIGKGVLCLRWMDNNIVRMLTTVHPWNEVTLTTRRKPRTTSSNAALVRKAFGKNERLGCYIPTVIDDYNHYMNGVDLADQRRASYTTHQRARRNWLAFLYFFLDISITNAHILFNMSRNQKLNHLLDLNQLKGCDLLSNPLAQTYPAELFRRTLFHELANCSITDRKHNSRQRQPHYRQQRYYKTQTHQIIFTKFSNMRKPWRQVSTVPALTRATTYSSESTLQSHPSPAILDGQNPNTIPRTSSEQHIIRDNRLGFSENQFTIQGISSGTVENLVEGNPGRQDAIVEHFLKPIPDRRRRECALCRYEFRSGQRSGRQRPKLTQFECQVCSPHIALCSPAGSNKCFTQWHTMLPEDSF